MLNISSRKLSKSIKIKMNLHYLTTIKRSLQAYLNHLTQKDSFCDLVDDKDQTEIKMIHDIYDLCDKVCNKYQELSETD